MKIYVDADGCPVVDIAINIAKKYGLEIVVVKNYAHEISDSYATIISVDISHDSADFYIINKVEKDDIIITQDYGLAALGLSKEAIPVNQNGLIFSQNNIDGMLNRRHIHRELRRQNIYYGQNKKRSSDADIRFEINLRKLIDKLISNE